jgi:hypothetical protein
VLIVKIVGFNDTTAG